MIDGGTGGTRTRDLPLDKRALFLY
jgi:hypothetical protein